VADAVDMAAVGPRTVGAAAEAITAHHVAADTGVAIAQELRGTGHTSLPP
jgi:hypothetical protein